jgi:hypothetical protein
MRREDKKWEVRSETQIDVKTKPCRARPKPDEQPPTEIPRLRDTLAKVAIVDDKIK